MKLLAFCVYDSKTECFSKPWFDVTVGAAIRSFSDACNEEGSDFDRHGADFTLFHIGAFNDELGKFDSIEPSSLGNALIFRVAETQEVTT